MTVDVDTYPLIMSQTLHPDSVSELHSWRKTQKITMHLHCRFSFLVFQFWFCFDMRTKKESEQTECDFFFRV